MSENVQNYKFNIENATNSMKNAVERIQLIEDTISKLNKRSTNLNQDYLQMCD